jgi:hypothetical protein
MTSRTAVSRLKQDYIKIKKVTRLFEIIEGAEWSFCFMKMIQSLCVYLAKILLNDYDLKDKCHNFPKTIFFLYRGFYMEY